MLKLIEEKRLRKALDAACYDFEPLPYSWPRNANTLYIQTSTKDGGDILICSANLGCGLWETHTGRRGYYNSTIEDRKPARGTRLLFFKYSKTLPRRHELIAEIENWIKENIQDERS